MDWIPNIFSTLKTWVFKKKLLKFSDRFQRETQACFYCPEMCRFSCPTAEALRDNAVTPRGKMSILHWMERGESPDKIAGTTASALWHLEQCTGCGRCTEYCLHEIDVGGMLRKNRKLFYREAVKPVLGEEAGERVFFCEPERLSWWQERPQLLARMGSPIVKEWNGPHREWLQGKISSEELREFSGQFGKAKEVHFESAEAAWFFASLFEEIEREAPKIKLVWQEFFQDWVRLELAPTETFHESYHLTRLLPRIGVSVPMYERGLLPQHSGWNVIDCGGEGYYKHVHPTNAELLKQRFIADIKKDGRELREIVCQSLECMNHLGTSLEAVYWLDRLFPDTNS